MKQVLVLSLLIIFSVTQAKSVKVTLNQSEVLDCKEEASTNGYFCQKDGRYLIIRSFGDFYTTFGNLNGEEKDRAYHIKKIESNEGSLIYQSNLSGYPGMGSYSKGRATVPEYKPYVPLQSFANHYTDISISKSIFDPHRYPGQEIIEPSQTYKTFLDWKLKEIAIKEQELSLKFKTPSVNLSLADGTMLTCNRETEKKKSKYDLALEKASGEEIVCGVFDCGSDKSGNKRMLISHYSKQQRFNNLISIGEDGFINTPKINSVSIVGDDIPLYAYDNKKNDYTSFYDEYKPELTKENYLPENLKKQSDFFFNMNTPNYEMVLRDAGRLCNKEAWKNFDQAYDNYQEKLANAKLAQYITEVGDTLSGYYLPLNQIPTNACRKNGVYYNPKAYSRAQESVTSFDPRVISIDRARELFNLANDMEDIAWDYKQDGCYARAHLMARRFEEMGVHIDKVWLKGDLSLDQPDGSVINWNFHVAPIVYIESPDGKVEKYVIDPSTSSEPIPVALWSKNITRTKEREAQETFFPFPENSTMYLRNSLAFTNSTPYLPNDRFKLTEEQKMKMADQTMKMYSKVIQ